MYTFFKRGFDFVFCALVLSTLAPFLLFMAVWIKIHDGGPILYAGSRVGRDGKMFRMLKFRTMVVNADKLGPSSTSDDDSRITPPGKLLRRFKLDELVQFLNVLKGEMSLVGPRPQVEWAVKLYSEEERALLSVRPGITDYASLRFRNEGEILKGSVDPDRDYLEKIAPMKIRLGLHYVRTMSFGADLKIIAATALAVLGVNPDWCLPAWSLPGQPTSK